MNPDSPTPVLLMAGVNRSNEPRRQKAIRQELHTLENTLRSDKSMFGLRVVPELPDEGVYLFDHFRQFQYQPEVALLHLSGYLSEPYFKFDGTMGEDTMDPVGFADILGRMPGLQVVFLNGCGHRQIIEQLLLRDIPAVISISERGPGRKPAKDIANRFYQHLMQGANIRESWLAVQEDFAGKLVYRKVHYELESDSLNWKGKHPEYAETDWGLYVLEENEHRLEWSLPPTTEMSDSVINDLPYLTAPLPAETPRSKVRIGLLVTSVILLLSAGGWSFWQYDGLTYVTSLFQPEIPCVFQNPDTYNVLQLPIHPQGDCSSLDPKISSSITRRLDRLADTEDGDDDFQVKYLRGNCPADQVEVEALIRTCQADVVLWGEYSKGTIGEVIFDFRYLYATGEASLDQGHITVRMPEDQLKADNDFISSGIEEVIYWTRANAHYSRQEYDQAIVFLSKIRERPTDNYLRVDIRLAQCFEQQGHFNKALERYHHMMAIDPDNSAIFNDRGKLYFRRGDDDLALDDFNQALLIRPDFSDALFNRGLVHLRTSRYPEAISDLQTVIRIQPKIGKPYGALAAVYAQVGDIENMYASLERALERGEELEQLLSYYSALQGFQSRERFQALAARTWPPAR